MVKTYSFSYIHVFNFRLLCCSHLVHNRPVTQEINCKMNICIDFYSYIRVIVRTNIFNRINYDLKNVIKMGMFYTYCIKRNKSVIME